MNRRVEITQHIGLIMAIERLLTGSIRDQVKDLMSTEDLVIEAFRDLVKDELKAHVRNVIDADPELKAEVKLCWM